MSVCPVCGKRVKMASGDKRKVQGVWHHKHRVKRHKINSDLVQVMEAGYLASRAAAEQLKALAKAGLTPTGRKPSTPEPQRLPKRRR